MGELVEPRDLKLTVTHDHTTAVYPWQQSKTMSRKKGRERERMRMREKEEIIQRYKIWNCILVSIIGNNNVLYF